MKKTITYDVNQEKVQKEINYIPVRYIIAVLITLFEVLAVIGIVVALCYYVPYFYLAAWLTEILCVIRVIASDDNPDYKVPWLLFLLIVPIAGFMLYFMFYSRTLQKKFIYMEYFIMEEGIFWNSILDILKRKASEGVEIKVLYDDIGCMMTLPGDYHKTLESYGIEATPFSRLKGNADSEFNNRSHRKILVIDGKIGYTGGVNIADEYINEVEKYGHWKDTAIRLEGEAVWELTKLFLVDFGINVKAVLVAKNECRSQNL